MSLETIVFLLLGAAAGGFINGLAGTGTALFALGFYLAVLEPISAVAIVAFMASLTGLQGLWVVRHEMFARPKRLLRFVVPGLIGVPMGLMLLAVLDVTVLRYAVAGLLIVYGLYFGFRAHLPTFARRTPVADACIGLTGGVFGGAAAVSGAIPALWLSLRPWPKTETRAVLQPFNFAILITTVVLLVGRGAYDTPTLTALAVTVPSGVIAAKLGIYVFSRLSDSGFRRLLILLHLLMGLGILASEVL